MNNNNSKLGELNLVIIWEKARYQQCEILSDLNKNFVVIECIEIQWTKEIFHENLTRFYGQKLPFNSDKEKHCGTGPFLLVTFFDKSPDYDHRNTSRGEELVNVNIFDKKNLYREWTGGGHKVHTTNGDHETKHDLALLLGTSMDEYIAKIENNDKFVKTESTLQKDLEGFKGWKNFNHLFKVLNACCNYVVMRNFEQISEYSSIEGDIDFLTESRIDFAYILNAVPLGKFQRKAAYKIQVSGQTIECDIREIGDEYYDLNWQKEILESSILENNIRIPSIKNYLPMLILHALIHKISINQIYKSIFEKNGLNVTQTIKYLDKFMGVNSYMITVPEDISVYYNYKMASVFSTKKKKVSLGLFLLRRLRQIFLVHLRIKVGQLRRGQIKNVFK